MQLDYSAYSTSKSCLIPCWVWGPIAQILILEKRSSSGGWSIRSGYQLPRYDDANQKRVFASTSI